MKGIVLAGGSGTRLYPLTMAVSKQLLPVYDKPMIYYSLSVLLMAGIRDVLLISTPRDIEGFRTLLGDGSDIGIHLEYAVQASPDGLAQAFVIGAEFAKGEPCALVLGDNIFYGGGFTGMLRRAAARAEEGTSTIFACKVQDPERFGVVEFDERGKALSIEEKPDHPRSNFCVTGLYFYDGHVADYAATLRPSNRGELEITDLNNIYLEKGNLMVENLGRGFAWFDTGTVVSLANASEFIRVVEYHTGVKVGSLEEIAYDAGWIGRSQLLEDAEAFAKTDYGRYLKSIAYSTRR